MTKKIRIDVNSDVGESFGIYKLGLDEEVIPHITSANIACGFHAGDPRVMRKTVALAKQYGVGVGAHPGFLDLILAGAFVAGLAAGGVASVGKHFPGHGYVGADSHVDVPVDSRSFDDIDATDLHPYRELIARGLGGVMPAHVIYPQVDDRPAGYSRVWLQDVLRGHLGFEGMIFSDDLSMEGARVAGGPAERALAAIEAGCDMVLLCNAPDAVPGVLEALKGRTPDPKRFALMRGRGSAVPDVRYAQAVRAVREATA